jgi:hypothetical protein
MSAAGDLSENLYNCSSGSSCGNCRGSANMHEVDHRHRCIRLSEFRRNSSECAWPETRAAKLRRQRESKKPGMPERIDGFG